MSDKSLPTRIPAENLGDVRTWLMPPVTDSGKVLSSAQKEARERRERMLKQGKEKIENVELTSKPKTGMTAQMVQEIFDAAEKDGFSHGHEAGFQKGQAEGYEAGCQQGLTEYRNQLAIEQQRFQSVMNTLLNPLTAQDNDIENMLLDIICTLTQSVIERELKTDSSHILNIVKTSIDALPIGSKNIRISLNPADLIVIESYAKEHKLEWDFVAENDLLPGGCRVDTLESRVDFSVSTRLQKVLEQFLTGQLATDENEVSS